jgi:Na+/H+-dicarboxylate symporter
MNDDVPQGIFAFFVTIALFIGFILGTCVGSYHTVSYTEVIQHGAAHYDPVTAKFTWNSSATAPIMAEAQKP